MFRESCLDAARKACELGFPTRICDGPTLTPQTGAPYLVPFATLYEWLGTNSSSKRLFQQLIDRVNHAGHVANIPAIMIGGSILRNPSSARDIDCILFYKMKPGYSYKYISDMNTSGVDFRLVPLDVSDEAFLIKMIGYFTLLYAVKRGESVATNGPVIIEPPFEIPG